MQYLSYNFNYFFVLLLLLDPPNTNLAILTARFYLDLATVKLRSDIKSRTYHVVHVTLDITDSFSTAIEIG